MITKNKALEIIIKLINIPNEPFNNIAIKLLEMNGLNTYEAREKWLKENNLILDDISTALIKLTKK